MNSTPTAVATLFLAASLLVSAPVAGSRSADTEPVDNISSRALRMQYLAAFEQYVLSSYAGARLTTYGVTPHVYREALLGYYSLQRNGLASQPVLTIIDFSLPSSEKRLWVIDLKYRKVLFHTLVAHGKNSGGNVAKRFSNVSGSEMSSLGFYVTGQTYQGKHGLSLKLHGHDASFNTNAASRSVVMHGANYVSADFVRQHGRLGHSQGCPALPVAQTPTIIRAIKNGSVVYAHGPSTVPYTSAWLRLDPALTAFAQQRGLRGS